ncbi:lipopolysaccharide biosynthesis protein [Arthrobacter sp. B1805]|uniref:lipopolysaccharide biosynthesis protein n=1 Tax=Arthrobacter sp. B1805 TaxID=2058892 RepID=UPI0011B05816|nr:lipopolysaccharide biosynthesis protein [Arthrobacter sp. B1805]
MIQAATYLLIARDAGPALFSIIAATAGAVLVAQAVSDLGVSTYLIRERAREYKSVHLTAALRVNSYTSWALTFLALAVFLATGWIYDSTYFSLIPICLWVGGDRLIETRLGLELADGRAHVVAVSLLLRRSVALAVYIILISIGESVLLSFAVSFSAGTLVGLGHLLRSGAGAGLVAREPISGAVLASVLRRCRPFWFNTAASQLRNLDTLIVTGIGGNAVGGLYGVVARSIGPFRILATSLAAVLLPAAVRTGRAGVETIRRPVSLLLGSLVLLYGIAVLLMPPVVLALLGEQYVPAIVPLQIVVAGLIFAATASVLTSLLQAGNREWIVGYIAASASVLSLGLCAIGVYYHGIVGAAIGVSLGFVLQCAMLLAAFFFGEKDFHQ